MIKNDREKVKMMMESIVKRIMTKITDDNDSDDRFGTHRRAIMQWIHFSNKENYIRTDLCAT